MNKKNLEESQKMWLFNPQRRKRKAQKLESNWEGLYKIKKKINDIIFCINLREKEIDRSFRSCGTVFRKIR